MQQTITGTFIDEAAKTRFTKIDDQSVAQTTESPGGTSLVKYHFVKDKPYAEFFYVGADDRQTPTGTRQMTEMTDFARLSNAYMALRQLGGHPFGIGLEQATPKKSWSLAALVPWGKKA